MTSRNPVIATPEADGLVSGVSTLNGAIDALQNGVRGYRTAAEEVDDADLAVTFRDLASSRQAVLDDVVRVAALEENAAPTDDSGTMAGAIHRGWMQLKAAVAGDEAIVRSALTGESDATADLSRALESDLAPSVDAALRRALLDVARAKERLERLVAS